jgi:hypothetical protein
VTRRIVVGIGIVVLAFVVVMAYLVWWPGLLDTLATMHGQNRPIHGGW